MVWVLKKKENVCYVGFKVSNRTTVEYEELLELFHMVFSTKVVMCYKTRAFLYDPEEQKPIHGTGATQLLPSLKKINKV